MKKLLMFLAVSVFAVQSYATETAKINKVVAEILNEIVAQDDFVESLGIVLDSAKTDIEKPKLGVSISASTKQAAWSDETTALEASLVVDTKPADENGQVEVSGNLRAELQTDVYELSKFIADKDLCEDYYFEMTSKSSACVVLQKELKEASTFTEQVKAVSKAFDGFKVELKAAIAELKVKQEAEQDEEEKTYIGYDIEDLEDALRIVESIVFTESDKGFTVKVDFGEEITEDLLMELTVKVNDSSVVLDLAFLFLVEEESIQSYSSFSAQVIQMLEANTPESREYVSSFAEGYIYLLKGIVTE